MDTQDNVENRGGHWAQIMIFQIKIKDHDLVDHSREGCQDLDHDLGQRS